MNKFSHRIKELRKEKGLRQKDIAMSLNLAQTTIANYEQGTRFPDEEMLKKISNYFQVSADYLLGITDVKSSFAYKYEEKSKGFFHDKVDELIDMIKRTYINLILDGNKHMASELIIEAISKGASLKKIYKDVFEYNFKVIGHMWEKGQIDIAEEHYFTMCTQQIMAQLYENIYSKSKRGHSIVLLTVGGEIHNMGIRIVTDFLEMEGYSTYFLGSNVPTHSVINSIKLYKAEILALSVTMDYNIDSLINLIHAVKNEKSVKDTKIIAGGQPFNLNKNLWKEVGADGYSENAEQAVTIVNSFFK
ncbi:methanogenic corrinoid protein MtbC1 [Clostridium tetanomorphum]|uniref:Helix-turn-helix domain-containing protein n=1 Tax=Clostridium tetanomorphum TaxID=1553 RepID=A0A923IYV5_CLOTT|nr:cobalamin-dependent protein [Clostridium tetanomorphum]KAJ52552.1 helix-turn-helix domain-containing protein [Clostridium tetanomorphum DSM 665]MBC2396297.1 helix-turn-helix domain-containing protein [Clostridium tetanomorphum]MBP1863472.1 methanogenic corrinoid protein MtbC1 [Clostridium tetanomorphum]NRS83570.1 methanogenic corrinoid protein MtbC1 [Clostridium tetanomorphum]NRZ96771.1 methanogenic corrinoid protein MtbC1 [Clostridium tetanomorphum]